MPPVFLRRRAAALFALVLAGTPALSAAQETPLPFSPPLDWDRIPTAILEPLLTWRSTVSTFSVSAMAVDLPPEYLAQVVKGQADAMGAAVSASGNPICDAPAYTATIKLSSGPMLFTSQVQSIDGTTYFSVYLHPESEAADPAIASLLSSFCGQKSVDAAVRPAGWRESNARLLGTWTGPVFGETVSLVSANPSTQAELAAQDAAASAFGGASSTILSKTTGSLCGVAATFVTARVQPAKGPKLDVTMELTQSDAAAYTLIYSHPTGTAPDDAATASLASLCASGVPEKPAESKPA